MHAEGKTRSHHEAISVLWIMDSLRGTGSKLSSCLLWPSLLCTRHNNIHPSCSSVPLFYLFLLLWNPTPQKSVFYPPFNGAICHRARMNCRWTGTQTAAVQKKKPKLGYSDFKANNAGKKGKGTKPPPLCGGQQAVGNFGMSKHPAALMQWADSCGWPWPLTSIEMDRQYLLSEQ